MSFYPQPNKYQCGPFALKYALVMLGQFRDERNIARKAGSTWWYGTDEIGLAKAARSFSCRMKHFSSSSPKQALRLLIANIKKGIPCILSVDNWEHWFTVVGYNHNKFVVVDSGLDKVIVIYSPLQLARRWRYYDSQEDFISYDGYALHPKFKVQTKGNLTVERAKQVMQNRNKDLAEKWDTYFNDLITICRPHSPNAKQTMSFTEFLRRHENLIVKQVANWHGTPSYSEIRKILKNFRFIAETYGLLIYIKDQKKALIDLASVLMMYACGKYGMDPIY